MWSEPKPPAPPPQPPSAHDQLVANIEDTIWAELKRQGEVGMGPYVDREMDMVDASGAGLDMRSVAEAVAGLFAAKAREVREQITEGLNAKYRDGSINQWDEYAAGKIRQLLDSIGLPPERPR